MSFSVTSTFAGNHSAAVEKLTEIGDKLLSSSKIAPADQNKINAFSSNVNNYLSLINALIISPSDLAATLGDLFSELPTIYNDPEETTAVLSQFKDFGDNDIEINQTTAGLVERKKNNDILNIAVKTFSLSAMYVSSSETVFKTVVQIEKSADNLELIFESIKESSGIGLNGLSKETLASLEDLRVTTQKFFDAEKLSAKRVITITTPVLPARVISYAYYGDSDSGEGIADLNSEINVSNMAGEIDTFTE